MDVHIAVDLARAVRNTAYNFVAVVSDDVDFAPAMAGAISDRHSGCEVVWMRASSSPIYLDTTLIGLGTKIVLGF